MGTVWPDVRLSDSGDEAPTSPQRSHLIGGHDSKSYLAICSESAVNWLKARVSSADEQSVTDIVTRLSRHADYKSTFMCPPKLKQFPEPDMQMAWKYCQEYFDNRVETLFGAIDRRQFEARLRAHLQDGDNSDSDPSWYALRNTIYATGTRLLLTRTGCDAKTIHESAMQYFLNALSVHTQVLFARQVDLTGVQALTIMSFFAENLLGSSIESMLCSNAIRPSDRFVGNRIWWALYCYDKHISLRDGRQSCIDDDDISCALPERQASENPNKFEIFMQMIKSAQIQSLIYKKLFSAAGRRQNTIQERAAVEQLDQALSEWRDSLPLHLRPGAPIKKSSLPAGVHIDPVVYMHYTYYGTVIAMYNKFPWTARGSSLDNAAFGREKAVSAARSVVLATRYIDTDMNTTGCLLFSYPMTALIVLFVHILQNPLAPSAHSDVVLMDMATGHFAQLEFATSMQLEVQFVRDMAHIARRAVEQIRRDAWIDVTPFEAPEPAIFSPTMTGPNLNFMDFLTDDVYAV
ncbi:Fungal specific transcription factor domain-containing protein [Cladophialophora immunda]|nr:Fungal specific transcription factor domain-containing protein [Cladophialophora immunda]